MIRWFIGITLAASALLAQSGARYLIITHDNFFDAIQPLADWKHKKGMKDTVLRLSQVGPSPAQIRQFVTRACSTWDPRPEFLLLVGSGYYIPAFIQGVQGPYRYYTDSPYANFGGDFACDIPYGRFPCKTPRQCSVMVNKTLAYERHPNTQDSAWLRRGTAVLCDLGDSDAEIYWGDARYFAELAGANGYVGFDSLASSLYNGATDVVQSVNQGTGFVLYRGVAGSNWYQPFAVNPGQTNNGDRLPIVCSFTCQTEALDRYDTMVGDAWLKVGTPSNLKGAVAFLGNTHSAVSVARQRSAMTHGFFRAVFADSVRHLGQAALAGKQAIYDQFRDTFDYAGFNLLGDPELNLRTTMPAGLTVVHDSVVLGPGEFPVQVFRDAVPAAGALVCLRDSRDAYAWGYTDSSGGVSLSIDPQHGGMLDVTVTDYNCVPYEGTARVVYGGVADAPVPPARSFLRLLNNPVRDGWIRLSPGAADWLRCELYAVNGERVRSFAPMPAGPEPTLSVAGVAPGMYFLRVTGRDETATLKFVIAE